MKITPIFAAGQQAEPEVNESWPHVLLVVDGMAGPLGGGERVALKLAALLPRYGYRVSILTFQAPTDPAVQANLPCPMYLLPLTNAFGFKGILAALQLRRFLREQRVLLVQTFFESSDLWAGSITKLMSSARLIWSRRDMGILRAKKHSTAYRLLGRMPDRVFAVSELVRQHCIEVDGIDPRRVQTIYNGLDLADWTGDGARRDRAKGTVFTTVGNIRHVKGHDVFIRAAAEVVKHYPDSRFSVAGSTLDKTYFEEIRELIERLGLKEHFHFAGGVRDLRAHFMSADVFVLPSRSEGFSNAIIEAMAMCLPVVATNVGGNAEAVADGVSGYIVPPEDPAALAASMLRLLADPDGAKAMGRAGRQLVFERFTTDAMMERVTAAYGEVLGKRPTFAVKVALTSEATEKVMSVAE